jgi:hypothetical protein
LIKSYFEIDSINRLKPLFLCSGKHRHTSIINALKLKLDYDDEFTTSSDKLRINLVAGGWLNNS